MSGHSILNVLHACLQVAVSLNKQKEYQTYCLSVQYVHTPKRMHAMHGRSTTCCHFGFNLSTSGGRSISGDRTGDRPAGRGVVFGHEQGRRMHLLRVVAKGESYMHGMACRSTRWELKEWPLSYAWPASSSGCCSILHYLRTVILPPFALSV